MKKTIGLLVALVVTAALFTACGGKEKPGTIQGTWEVTGRTHNILKKDGSFIRKDTLDDRLTERGTYTMKGDRLMITIGPNTEVYRILGITSDLAKLKPVRNGKEDTGHRRWKRVD